MKTAEKKIVTTEYNDSVVVEKSPKEGNLNGYVIGKVVGYKAKDKIEQNLLSQIATYNSALLHGDKNNCVQYLYKDAITYFRKYYSGFSDEVITDEFFKSASHSYEAQLQKLGEHGIEFNIVVANLIRKVVYDDKIFFVFNISSNLFSDAFYIHSQELEQTVGISENNGKKWTFLTVNDDTPNILRLSNSEEVIDAVMGY